MQIKDTQKDFLDWEFGTFFHFGIRTFYEGHKDWDMKEMPLSGFKPEALDCGEWIRISKEAGARYAILVCKHHDGFANWPSAYTDYSVANTPWKNGKGDVVREFTDACRRYGLKVGLYYSTAQFGSINRTPEEYNEYVINQVSELLTNYGKIDYLWFDSNGSDNLKIEGEKISGSIRHLQPDVLLFGGWDSDTRWIQNESGFAPSPHYNVKEIYGKKRFIPSECDFRMRRRNWFYSDMDEDTVKSLDELMGIYYYSVGRGANMLLNIGPDRRGLLPNKDADRLLEFGAEIRRRFSRPVSGSFVYENDSFIYSLKEPVLVDHVVLKESYDFAEPVENFTIKAYPLSYGDPITIFEGRTIGHKAVCKFPSFYTNKIEISIDKKGEKGRILSLEVFAGENQS